MNNLAKAILIINAAKKGWTEEARRKAAMTRKRKVTSEISEKKKPGKSVLATFKGKSAKQTKDAEMWTRFASQKGTPENHSKAAKSHAAAMAFHKAKGNKEGVAFHKQAKEFHSKQISGSKETAVKASSTSKVTGEKVQKNLSKYVGAFQKEGWNKLTGSKSSIAKQVDEMWDAAGRTTNPKSMTKENKEYRKALIDGLYNHYKSKK